MSVPIPPVHAPGRRWLPQEDGTFCEVAIVGQGNARQLAIDATPASLPDLGDVPAAVWLDSRRALWSVEDAAWYQLQVISSGQLELAPLASTAPERAGEALEHPWHYIYSAAAGAYVRARITGSGNERQIELI